MIVLISNKGKLFSDIALIIANVVNQVVLVMKVCHWHICMLSWENRLPAASICLFDNFAQIH